MKDVSLFQVNLRFVFTTEFSETISEFPVRRMLVFISDDTKDVNSWEIAFPGLDLYSRFRLSTYLLPM